MTTLFNIDAEQAVLGALLNHPNAIDKLEGALAASDFYHGPHRLIFAAMTALLDAHKPVDTFLVAQALEERGSLPAAGGLDYLLELHQNTASGANIRHYADLVKERGMVRRLNEVAADILAMTAEGGKAEGMLNAAEQMLLGIRDQRQSNGGPVHIFDAYKKVVAQVEERIASGNEVAGLPTGYTELDQQTTGLYPGDLIVIAGRPASGKTAFGINIAEHVAVTEKLPVLVFSMEMPDTQLASRLTASVGRVNMQNIKTGRLSDRDWDGMVVAGTKFEQTPLWLVDDPYITLSKIRATCRRVKREHGLALIVVDYLQLMEAEANSRTEEVSKLSRGLKLIAKEFGCPVLALSQLSRKCEERPNKRPIPSDLRESGSIEQDCDTILMIYRDEVYNPDSPAKGTAEIIIGKQRNGPIGTVRLAYKGEYTRFENYTGPDIDTGDNGYTPPPARGFRD